MTKEAVLHNFYNSFGIPAYEENTVPDGAAFPYITYSVVVDSMMSQVFLTANLWYRSSSWTSCNAKAREMYESIASSGVILPCDGGGIWIKPDTPFAQNMNDPSDDQIRRKYLRIVAEYITN